MTTNTSALTTHSGRRFCAASAKLRIRTSPLLCLVRPAALHTGTLCWPVCLSTCSRSPCCCALASAHPGALCRTRRLKRYCCHCARALCAVPVWPLPLQLLLSCCSSCSCSPVLSPACAAPRRLRTAAARLLLQALLQLMLALLMLLMPQLLMLSPLWHCYCD